ECPRGGPHGTHGSFHSPRPNGQDERQVRTSFRTRSEFRCYGMSSSFPPISRVDVRAKKLMTYGCSAGNVLVMQLPVRFRTASRAASEKSGCCPKPTPLIRIGG